MKKVYLLCGILSFLLLACSKSPRNQAVESPDQAIAALQLGNERFVQGNAINPDRDSDLLNELIKAQHPFAAVVACSDSRVPVELLFDQGFGDLFVIRNAGNTVAENITQGSVDYAVDHLGVQIVVVLEHTSCGAITGAACKGEHHDAHELEDDGYVPELLHVVGDQIPEYIGQCDMVNEAAKANARVQVERMLKAGNIRDRVKKGVLKVVPAIYNIKDKRVYFIE